MSMKRTKPRATRGTSRKGEDGKSSVSKKAEPERSWGEYVAGKPDDAFVPYSLKSRFSKGTLIMHSKFGKGVVVAAVATNIDVLFEDARRKLSHSDVET